MYLLQCKSITYWIDLGTLNVLIRYTHSCAYFLPIFALPNPRTISELILTSVRLSRVIVSSSIDSNPVSDTQYNLHAGNNSIEFLYCTKIPYSCRLKFVSASVPPSDARLHTCNC